MNETVHLSTQFDEDLENLRSKVLEMGGLVEAQINQATKAYTQNNNAAVLDVLENDREVNKLEKTIDDDCIHIIAKRQPTASDLRLVMSISKMVTDLERSGDEVKKMAKSIRRIQERDVGVLKTTTDVKHLADAAGNQLRSALDTFARLDTEEARIVIEADLSLDTEFKAIVRQLITFMMEDPRSISTALDVITISRCIERVGDHAKNIAEQVIYIVEGRDVRHTDDDAS
ncbi:MAG TPA: phosphate signaling complex protein PhoU [Methylophilaceae bacterium]|nr:phosphate signaling complex protein PhoU [Methylophilaceae bacterium]